MTEDKHKVRGALLLQEDEPSSETTKASEARIEQRKIIGADTLVLFDTLDCDVLANTVIDDVSYEASSQLLSIFKSFLEDVCGSINVSHVLSKYVKQE